MLILSEKVKQYIYRQPIVTFDSSSIAAYHMAAVVEKIQWFYGLNINP